MSIMCPHCGKSITIVVRGTHEVGPRKVIDWVKVDDRLGKVPDIILAKELGVAVVAVWERRTRRNIPSFRRYVKKENISQPESVGGTNVVGMEQLTSTVVIHKGAEEPRMTYEEAMSLSQEEES